MSPVEDAHSDFRGTGRTTRMLMDIDPKKYRRAIVLVHNSGMGDHIRMLLEKHRPDVTPDEVVILIINSECDLDRLRGLSGSFHVDHAVWKYIDVRTNERLQIFLRMRELHQ